MKPKLFLTLLVISISSSLIAQVPTDYIANYSFDNATGVNQADPGVGDLTGGNFTYTADRFNNPNKALDCNGIRREGFSAPITGVNAITNEFSVSFWVKLNTTTPTNVENILDIVSPTTNNGVSFRQYEHVGSKRYEIIFKIGNVTKSKNFPSASLSNGDWSHIVLQSKELAGNLHAFDFYFNGNYESLSTDLSISTTDNLFGSNNADIAKLIISSGSNFSDNIDDIQLYNRKLTSSEISSIYASGSYVSSKTLYVDASAVGNNNGTDWIHAFTTIQSAINEANPKDSIFVKAGTYKPITTNNPTVAQRQVSIKVNKELYLYGGFNGTETYLKERDINTYVTTLSGDLKSDDSGLPAFNATNRVDNSRTILRLQASNVVIDGFKITNGYAEVNSSVTEDINATGAGIYVDNNVEGNITIRNCHISQNYASKGGAGIFYWPRTRNNPINFTVENTKFSENYSIYGSGMFLRNVTSTLNLKITNALFYKNKVIGTHQVGEFASCVWVINNDDNSTTNADIINSTFVNNEVADARNANVNDVDRSAVVFSHFGTNTGGVSPFTGVIANSIFKNNTYIGNTGALPSPASVYARGSARPNLTVDYSADINQFSRVDTKTNLIADPITFVDETLNDYALDTNSAGGIDQGNNAYVTNIPSDIIGNQRIHNTTVDLGAYEFGSNSLSIADNSVIADTFRIYPNPVRDVIYVSKTSNSSILKVAVYSLTGKKLLQTVNPELNVSNLNSGMYFMTIESTDSKIATKKFMKY